MPGSSTAQMTVLWTRGLLIRRRIADDDLAFFTTWCPAGTAIETLVAVSKAIAGRSRTVFETAKKTSSGSITMRSRSWHGWHRHVSMVMLAFAMMAVIRHHANSAAAKKKKRNAEPRQNKTIAVSSLIRWSIQEVSAHRHQARSKADPARPTSSHGHSGAEFTRRSLGVAHLKAKTATVMLVVLGAS